MEGKGPTEVYCWQLKQSKFVQRRWCLNQHNAKSNGKKKQKKNQTYSYPLSLCVCVYAKLVCLSALLPWSSAGRRPWLNQSCIYVCIPGEVRACRQQHALLPANKTHIQNESQTDSWTDVFQLQLSWHQYLVMDPSNQCFQNKPDQAASKCFPPHFGEADVLGAKPTT